MKTQKSFERKLNLKKETISRLNDRKMIEVAGGSGDTCNTFVCCCDTSVPIPTGQNPCPIPFTEAPISKCC